jgi:hypothetical protein
MVSIHQGRVCKGEWEMKTEDYLIGMHVHGAINNRYFQGVITSLFLTMDSDGGLVPSAQIALLPDTDNYNPLEKPITVPVTNFEE